MSNFISTGYNAYKVEGWLSIQDSPAIPYSAVFLSHDASQALQMAIERIMKSDTKHRYRLTATEIA